MHYKHQKWHVFTDRQVCSTSFRVFLITHRSIGTGKTHTLIEIIRQMTTVTPSNPKPLRLLVCGASNLSVDNILERLLALPPPENGERLRVTRVGHPARVMAHQGVLDSTLEVKAGRTDAVNVIVRVIICEMLMGITRQPWRKM